MDATGESDPYILFYCPTIGIDFDADKNPMYKTNFKPQTLEPKWDDDEVPVMKLMTADKDIIRNSYLMISMQAS